MSGIDIIVTLGPRSWSDESLRALLGEGVRTFRFPYSKETPEHHTRVHGRLRSAAERGGFTARAWADLPGGKPRLDNAAPQQVFASRTYRVALWDDVVQEADFRVEPRLVRGTVAAEFIVGDGPLTFIVDEMRDGIVQGRFTNDALLQPTRGFLPRGGGSIAVLTDRDRDFAAAAHAAGMDGIALSFVASASDVEEARTWLSAQFHWQPQLIAKIETPAAVVAAGDIADAADHVMIARGDLALTAGVEHLWWSQKRVIDACRSRSKPVIVATGLIESSENDLIITRSNAIDVGTALQMGATALLLSAETTIGRNPLGAVKALRRQIDAWFQDSTQ